MTSMATAIDCPSWCATDHLAEREMQEDSARKATEEFGVLVPVERYRRHSVALGSGSPAVVVSRFDAEDGEIVTSIDILGDRVAIELNPEQAGSIRDQLDRAVAMTGTRP